MKVLMVEPGENPHETDIEPGLEVFAGCGVDERPYPGSLPRMRTLGNDLQ